jgi:hypothetical protein
LEYLPGEDWFDNATRTPCPACHEFAPLGALMCLNINCSAAFHYVQHRFRAKAERFVISQNGSQPPGNRRGGHTESTNKEASSAASTTPAETEHESDVKHATEKFAESVNKFIKKGQVHGKTSQVSPPKQFH